MKKMILIIIACIGLVAGSAHARMTVVSDGIKDGQIADIYGKRGPANTAGMPTYSLPLSIQSAPKKTKSYAVFIEDKDAYGPSGGFAWTHWLAANITRTELKANESQTASDYIQGANSWTSIQGGEQFKEHSSYYGGMSPPDGPHTYEIHVYALDKILSLKKGFGLGELFHAMDGHILDQYTLKGIYKN